MATHTLHSLTYQVARELGILKEGFATGGSTTTIIDTVERTEDNDFWNGGTAWILRDAGGAGAAPQGEQARITDHVASTATVTITTLTAAVASGDRYAVASNWVPLSTLVSQINAALLDLGNVPTTDTASITIASAQTEYTLPAAAGLDLRKVYIQSEQNDSNDNRWLEVTNWEVQHAAAGSQDLLVLPVQYPSGYDLKLLYMAPHGAMSVAADPLNEHVPPERVVYPAVLGCLYYLAQKTDWNRWDKYIRKWEGKVEQVRQSRPIKFPRRPSRLMIVRDGVYVNDSEPNKVRL